MDGKSAGSFSQLVLVKIIEVIRGTLNFVMSINNLCDGAFYGDYNDYNFESINSCRYTLSGFRNW